MAFIVRWHLLFTLTTSALWGKPQFPELILKQAVSQIRYITEDGRYTYYLQGNGRFFVSSNYQVKELLATKPPSQITVQESNTEKHLIFLHEKNFLQSKKFFRAKDIYISEKGELSLEKIGEGINPRFHLNDEWISYYDPYKAKIHVLTTRLPRITYTLQLKQSTMRNLPPSVALIDSENLLFSDYDKNGFPILISYNKQTQLFAKTLGSNNKAEKFELCELSQGIAFGRFPHYSSNVGSSIDLIPRDIVIESSNWKNLYTSLSSDKGVLSCLYKRSEILWLRDPQEKSQDYKQVISSYNLLQNRSDILTPKQNIINYLVMDDRILFRRYGKYYIVRGNTLPKDDSLGDEKK